MTYEELAKVPFEQWHEHLDHEMIVQFAKHVVAYNVLDAKKTDYRKVKLWCERIIALEEMDLAMGDLIAQGIVEEREQDNENE